MQFFHNFYKNVIFPDFFDKFYYKKFIMKNPLIYKLEITFFISDIFDLEDIKLLNFFQFVNESLNFIKKGYIFKILSHNRKSYKFCIKYTFRNKIIFEIFEIFLSKINNLSLIERSSIIDLYFFDKKNILNFNIKKFIFFEDFLFLLPLPKITTNVNIFFKNIENVKIENFLIYFGLNEDIKIKIIK